MEATTFSATVSGFDQHALSKYVLLKQIFSPFKMNSRHFTQVKIVKLVISDMNPAKTDSTNLLVTQKMSWKNSRILFFIFQ